MNQPLTDLLTKHQEKSTWVELNQTALLHNLEQIKLSAMPTTEVLAVVKANAYGHGLLPIAQLLQPHVAYFGVATIDEALVLREAGIATPILLFGVPLEAHIRLALERQVTLSVSSIHEAVLIQTIAEQMNRPAVIHIKVDTGMGRLGIPLKQAKKEIPDILHFATLKAEGIYTHLPAAELADDAQTNHQLKLFDGLLSWLNERHIAFAYRHAANSAAIINYKHAHLNVVRPGISLYGIYPDQSLTDKIKLTPVLSWKARVALIKSIEAGDSVGYGRTFVASARTRIAIIPVGYSHGYPFRASNRSRVLIHGKFYPVIGRVSMDYLAVEINHEHVVAGDVVTLMGIESDYMVTASELAEAAGTIPYEIVTRINHQIPRMICS